MLLSICSTIELRVDLARYAKQLPSFPNYTLQKSKTFPNVEPLAFVADLIVKEL